jgi:ubiquinone/menaquinone biosynthesis C-methylase UbiE
LGDNRLLLYKILNIPDNLKTVVTLDKSWALKKKTMTHYNTTARLYNQQYLNEQMRKYAVTLNIVKTSKKEYLLDVGCGTGLFIKEIAEGGSIIIGIDISQRMIEIAKNTCKNLSKINLICADVDSMPLRKKIIDKIFSFTLLQNTPDVYQTIKELLRVAKADSTIILTFHKKTFSHEEVEKVLKKLRLVITRFIDYKDLKDYLVINTVR